MNERELFDAALAIADPGKRSQFLDEACAADSPLREHLRGLLAARDKLGGFLEQPLPVAGEATSAPHPAYKPGALIAGRYKLLEQIGEGGMGAVWVAEQTDPVKRRVALKLIKPGMDSRQVLSRFEAERQALALMDHPNIARVFDGGMTDEGRPYFVMEYVKGVPITDYCDQARLPIAERLKLFVSVCQAVQHAHQKGIIHRDLKPSNILVCLYDGQPVPKVIDFGLAKAMHQSLTERTLYTAHGLMVGTPLYMSPEQAEFNNLDVDTRTDVYSLGVLLYELLTGSTPLEQRQFKDAAFAEILRLIKEEEPTRPSLKLSGSASLPSIAAQRSVEPGQLSRAVKGDLDWIVMKSLEKERSRRYETANGMARDVERYLADEAVEACPPSLRYRLSKVLRRNRGPVIAAGLVFLALTAGIIGTTIGLVRANAERGRALLAQKFAKEQAEAAKQAADAEAIARRRATEEAAAAKAVRDFLQDDLLRQASLIYQAEIDPTGAVNSQFKKNPTINELLDRAAAELAPDKIETKFPQLPFVQAEVLKAVGDAYAGVAPEKAIDHLHRSIERYRSTRGPEDPATIAAQHSLGVALFAGAKDAEAKKLLEEVRDLRARVLGPFHDDTFATRDVLGRTYLWLKDHDAAIAYFLQLHSDARTQFGDEHVQTLKARFHLGSAYRQAGRLDDALEEMESVKRAVERLYARTGHPDPVKVHPYMLSAAMEMGMLYKDLSRHNEAARELEKCLLLAEKLNLGTRGLWIGRHQLGWSYLAAGRRNDAIKTFEANLAIAGPAESQDVITMEALGWALREVDFDRAIGLYEQARKLRVERNGPDDLEALRVGHKQALLLRENGKPSEALALLEELLPRLEKVHGPEQVMVFKGQIEKGRCLAALKEFEAADALFRDTLDRAERTRSINNTEILEGRHQWMLAVQGRNDHPRTAEMAGELASQWRGADPSQPLRLASALLAQGSSFVKAGRPGDGEPALREAVAIYAKTSPQSWTIANARQWHGAALQEQGKLAEAEPLLVAAFTEMTERLNQMPRWGKNHRQDVAQRLIALYMTQNKPEEAAKWQYQLDALRGETVAETASAKE